MHRLQAITITLLASAAVASSCGPEAPVEVPEDAGDRLAEALCSAVERCGCLADAFDDGNACRQQLVDRFWSIERAEWSGEFNEDCFEKLLELIADNDCDQGDTSEREPLGCEVFPGRLSAGDACPTPWELGSLGGLSAGPCKGDRLSCDNTGLCVSPGPAQGASEGESCDLAQGVSCDRDSICNDGICVPRAAPGEACVSPRGCTEATNYCAGVTPTSPGVCREKIPTGDPCDPSETDSCEWSASDRGGIQFGYCSQAGVCREFWPSICLEAVPRPDMYWLPDWAP